MCQLDLARECDIAIGAVNRVLKKFERLGAVEIKPQGFRVIDIERILLYWANHRDLYADIALRWPTGSPITDVERTLSTTHVLTCFSGFKARFKKVLREYDQVFVYGDSAPVRRAFAKVQEPVSEIIVLNSDPHLIKLAQNNVAPVGQLFVDLWQIGNPGKPWIDFISDRVRRTEIGAIRGLIRRTRRET